MIEREKNKGQSRGQGGGDKRVEKVKKTGKTILVRFG